MPKICIQSPEIAMNGDIAIHAQVSIVTKAKLDEISVQVSPAKNPLKNEIWKDLNRYFPKDAHQKS